MLEPSPDSVSPRIDLFGEGGVRSELMVDRAAWGPGEDAPGCGALGAMSACAAMSGPPLTRCPRRDSCGTAWGLAGRASGVLNGGRLPTNGLSDDLWRGTRHHVPGVQYPLDTGNGILSPIRASRRRPSQIQYTGRPGIEEVFLRLETPEPLRVGATATRICRARLVQGLNIL